MITIEQIEEAFGDDRNAFKTKGIDHGVTAISLLRERIPYDICKRIIGSSEHDVLYLCDVDKAMPYLSTEDLEVLADCNVWYDDESECFALFT